MHYIYTFCVLGGKIGQGHFMEERPTYLYPLELKSLVKARFPEDLQDRPDPSGSSVCIGLQ